MNLGIVALTILAGGFGAGLRYGASRIRPPKKDGFPYSVFVVNILGSLLLGIITALCSRTFLSPEWGFVLAVGFCGGFTTMSTFAVESIERLRSGNWLTAGLNIVSTTAAGLLAVVGGYLLAGGPVI